MLLQTESNDVLEYTWAGSILGSSPANVLTFLSLPTDGPESLILSQGSPLGFFGVLQGLLPVQLFSLRVPGYPVPLMHSCLSLRCARCQPLPENFPCIV